MNRPILNWLGIGAPTEDALDIDRIHRTRHASRPTLSQRIARHFTLPLVDWLLIAAAVAIIAPALPYVIAWVSDARAAMHAERLQSTRLHTLAAPTTPTCPGPALNEITHLTVRNVGGNLQMTCTTVSILAR